jgi:hypothetical protein
LAWELASAGELLIHPGKPICNGLIAAMSAACEVFAFAPRPLARQAAALGRLAADQPISKCLIPGTSGSARIDLLGSEASAVRRQPAI